MSACVTTLLAAAPANWPAVTGEHAHRRAAEGGAAHSAASSAFLDQLKSPTVAPVIVVVGARRGH